MVKTMSKISKSEKVDPVITAETTELRERAEQAIAAGYELTAVDAKALLDAMKHIEWLESVCKEAERVFNA